MYLSVSPLKYNNVYTNFSAKRKNVSDSYGTTTKHFRKELQSLDSLRKLYGELYQLMFEIQELRYEFLTGPDNNKEEILEKITEKNKKFEELFEQLETIRKE